jgi:hypothetical protein
VEGAIFKKPVNPAKLRQMLAQARQKAQGLKAAQAGKSAATAHARLKATPSDR